MTVQATTSRADYNGNGATLAFTVPFYFLDNTHVKIIRTQISTGVPTTLTLTTDYSLTGAGVGAGGTVTMVVAPTTDQRIAVLRNVPFTQLIHYVTNDPFPAATHEQALDQLTMEIQQMNETLGRALTLDSSVVNASGALPAPTANAYIGWNSTGTGFQNYAGLANVTVSSAMQPVVQATNVASARSLLGAAASGANTDITSLGNLTSLPSNVSVTTQALGDATSNIASTAFVANGALPSKFSLTAVASAAGNLTLNTGAAFSLSFRNANTANGTLVTATVPANTSITAPAGATLGGSANQTLRLTPILLYNAGNVTMGLANAGGVPLDESALLNTTVMNTSSNSSFTVYSNTAITNSPFVIMGGVRGNQSTLGNWSGANLTVQAIGTASYVNNAPLSNISSATRDQVLLVGESTYLDISAQTSVPLNIATGDNQLYEIVLTLAGNGTTGANTILKANNTTYTNFFVGAFNTIGSSSSVYQDGFLMAYAMDLRQGAYKVSTKTTSKGLIGQATGFNSGTTYYANEMHSTWLSVASNSGSATDTTTLYTSLGTIVFTIAATGRIYIRRLM